MTEPVTPVEETRVPRRAQARSLVRAVTRSWTGRVGLGLVGFTVCVVMLGPYLSPFSPTQVVGVPFQPPSVDHWLGTDHLGRDAFSRYLHGGRTLLAIALVATTLAYLVGISVGLLAGYRQGRLDLATVSLTDVVLSIPPIIFVLLIAAALGTQLTVIVVAIAIVHTPRIVRIVRSLAIETTTQEYVEAAVARGERTTWIVSREILPTIWTPILADFGLRFAGSVILFSSLSYLGLGQAPPAADWGLMISENRSALLFQPSVVALPAASIATLTIGVNMVVDTANRSLGRSLVDRGV